VLMVGGEVVLARITLPVIVPTYYEDVGLHNTMSAPDVILKLVQRFEEQHASYKTAGYNETQTRRDFIDPFFKALGWDLDNEFDYAEAYRDVIHEDIVLVGNAKKAPDYSFRVGGTRKFFVEAKKPWISIRRDPKSAFQIRRYGWSAKLAISILTNFEDFLVYDCTHKPGENDPALKACLYQYRYDQYDSKWDEISALFSKSAVYKGSLDRFAVTKKKGSTTVDEAFLAEIETWREALARNIVRRNTISTRDLNLSVQLTIDRIIFLRICEDRSIEDYERLLKVAKKRGIYSHLGDLFKDADDRYNSGLFHFNPKEKHATPTDILTLKLKIDDAPLKEIIESLYPPNPYEFSVIPADILGQIYERFLGKVIQVNGKEVAVEEKPEVKKAGGVFYTPSYVVDYIVGNTVDRQLVGKSPKQVEKIKIVDPACGSGSFLIAAYQRLLDWHLNYYVANGGTNKFKHELHKDSHGLLRLTTKTRKAILLNNIHGVDIDAQAVEVTKLSLLLKVLEGESGERIGKNRPLFHERVLPDLGNNIKRGNSLVGTDFYSQPDLPVLTEDDHERIYSFDWRDEFPSIFKAGGFDVVIGNPPFVLVQTIGKPLFTYLSATYDSAKYKIDTYPIFLEKSIQIASKNAAIGYIVPNTFLKNKHCIAIRSILCEKTRIEILHLYDYNVFQGASVDTLSIVLTKSLSSNGQQVRVLRSSAPGNLAYDASVSQEAWKKADSYVFDVSVSASDELILSKMEDQSDKLYQVSEGVTLRGIPETAGI
jgi:predicted type IV restriction endonuclease